MKSASAKKVLKTTPKGNPRGDSAKQLDVRSKEVKFERTEKQKRLRSKREKFERESKMKLGKQQQWIINVAPTAEKAEKAFERLKRQQEAGLQAVEGRVLGLGTSPEDCVAALLESCSQPDLRNMKSELLYERLCELSALDNEITKHMLILMNIMVDRGFMVVSGNDHGQLQASVTKDPVVKEEPVQENLPCRDASWVIKREEDEPNSDSDETKKAHCQPFALVKKGPVVKEEPVEESLQRHDASWVSGKKMVKPMTTSLKKTISNLMPYVTKDPFVTEDLDVDDGGDETASLLQL